MKQRRHLIYFFALLLALGMGCTSNCQAKKNKEDKLAEGQIAAKVNDTAISLSELDKLHKRAEERLAQGGREVAPQMSQQMRASILKKMMDDEIIKQKAEQENVKVDRFERVAALEQYKAKMGGQKGFEVFLQRSDLSEEQLIDTIVSEKTRDKLVEKLSGAVVPSEKDILDHYNKNSKSYTVPEMIKASHILFKLSPNDPQAKADLVLKKAKNVLDELNKPGADFASIAKKYSECPSAPNGGDLGFFPHGRMVKPFEEAAFAAPLKKIIGPIKTDYGYHLIYVTEKTSMHTAPLAEVRDRIIELLNRSERSRKSEQILSDLRKKASISINDPSLKVEEYKAELATKAANPG